MGELSNLTRRLIVCLFLVLSVMCQTSTVLELDQQASGTLGSQEYAYFKVKMPNTVPPQAVLLVTVDGGSTLSYPIIFMSTESEFPDYNNNDEACFFQSMDTCSRTNLLPNQTVYISILSYVPSNYTIVAEMTAAQPVEIGHSYEITFSSVSSGLISFYPDMSYDYLLIVLEYVNFYTGQQYEMVESCGYVPSDGNYDTSAEQLGAFRKAIRVKRSDIKDPNSTCYLLISGYDNIQLKLTLQESNHDEKSIVVNSTIYDIVDTNTTYSYGLPFSQANISDALVLRMRQLSGYGFINVNYCGEDLMSFEDMNGENGQLVISPAERNTCLEHMKGMLLIEDLLITVSPYYGDMGVVMTLYEGEPDGVTVQVNYLEYAVLYANTSRKYKLNIYYDHSNNVSLTEYNYEGDAVLQLQKCGLFGCTAITPKIVQDTSYFEYDTNCRRLCHYELKATCPGPDTCKLGFVFKMQGYHINLQEGKSDLGFVRLNEYVFYNITVGDPTNVTSVTVRMESVSGTLAFLASQEESEPTFSKLFNTDSDIIYVWNGTATFRNNLSYPIYVGVLGETEGLYRISVTVNRNENIPSMYTLLTEDTINEFVLDGQPLLLKYSPHSIPYSVGIYPRPKCISYGHTLPLEQTCMDLPDLLNYSIYINITGTAGSNLRVYVDEGSFLLTYDHPLFIQCESECWENVYVYITNYTERVVHSGYGKIINNETKEEFENGVFDIECPAGVQRCQVPIIARLDYGGEMTLTLESGDIFELVWWTQPVSLSSLPRKFFYKLPQNQSTVINIDSRAAVLKVAYKVQLLNESFSNLLELYFSTNYINSTDPFKRSFMIEINERQMEETGCNKYKAMCILTVTLTVDETYEYSEDFVNNGIIYVSASSGSLFMTENVNYRRVTMESVAYFSWNSNMPKDVEVRLTPITNCRPRMYYTSKEGILPTNDNYEKSGYKNITVKEARNLVIGVEVEEELCLYDIILLTEFNKFTLLVSGVPQRIDIGPGYTAYLLFNSFSSGPFEILSTFDNLMIYVNEVPYGEGASQHLPSARSYKYSSQSAPLWIRPNVTSNYVIALTNTRKVPIRTNAMIRYENEEVLMLHNTLYSESTEVNQTDEYAYYSANSFYVFFMSSQGSFNVSVYSYTGYNQSFTFDDNTTEPWILINNDGRLSAYYIDVSSVNIGKYTIEVIEYGSEGRPTLESGLPFFDSFPQRSTVNCYRLDGSPDDTTPIQLSFVFSRDLMTKMHTQNIDVDDVSPLFFYDFKTINSEVSPAEQPKLLKEMNFDQGTTYIIEQKYGTYTFCFQSGSDQMIDDEYYVIASRSKLQSLLPSVPLLESHTQNKSKSTYELVVLDNYTIVTELINCRGDSQLTATSDYEEAKQGQTTYILTHYSDGPYYSGLVNASRGYFYLGVQSMSPNNTYMIRTTSYPANNAIRLTNWKLSDVQLKYHGNGSNLIVALPTPKCISTNCSATKQLIYHLYLTSGCSTAMAYSRCGLKDSNNTLLAYRLSYGLESRSNVTFTISSHLLPKKFSMSAKVESLEENYGVNRTVPYFYNTEMDIKLSDVVDTEGSSASWGTIIVVFLAVIIILLTLVIMYCRKKGIGFFKPKPTVSFELTPLNNLARQEAPVNDSIQKRMYERDVGPAYGEFVDYSRL